MIVGLYFGSFNPIHIGHLIIADFVAANTQVKQVWFVVSPQNPLKKSSTLLNEYDRLHLVNTAIEGNPSFRASNVEFLLPRPSYTIDTLTYLKEKYPSYSFLPIIGSDSLLNIQQWKNSELLLEQYSFLVYERPGFKVMDLMKNVVLLKAPLLEISSTHIRANIKEERSIRYLVTDKVREEIERNRYYK
jgi:nicotinate-nucleotide adenylyltransferase